ncbi:transcriptional regulator [Clostridium beijerinckii]|uniref:Transcriptional regulator n=1 Tax=Clostridium beijerinckii TaxID=1520 RepID=A0A0B5QGS3_CLOBE|nr:helix-turn-helix transcriptional regulator [Clostridium beijerinckii]AJG97436.1 transcriptional regulator [Clostridium beijerinckii]
MDNPKQRYKELGDFLRTRRAKILPSQVGLPEGTRRRTIGLRREEVSFLSGVGLTWYTWLEQGRPITISSQVIESLARTLMLDKKETMHLYNLARLTPPTEIATYDNTVNPMLKHVLDNIEFSPATILDQRYNVIAWNRASEKLLYDYNKLDTSKRNMLRIMFTNEEYKKTIIDWESTAQSMLARFRIAYGKLVEDPYIKELVEELKSESKEFNSWWTMHNVEMEEEIVKSITHPILGELNFEYTSYMVLSDKNLRLTILTALPRSDTEKKIKQFLLG